MAPMNVAIPATSHGNGFKCSSHPLAVAVCQQVAPGPARCNQATERNRTPAPVSSPNAELRITGLEAIRPPTAAIGASTSTPSDTKPSAAIDPRNAHTQNQPQLAA